MKNAKDQSGDKEAGVAETSLSLLSPFKGRAARTAQPRRPRRVLVVDDEESVRRFVDRVLREAGYQTAIASDGPDALRVAREFMPVEILVTDLMMPQMNGDELARRLRQIEPNLKVLYLTGFSDQLFKEKTTLWQDEAFLDKPCSVRGLREAVSLLAIGRIGLKA